MLYVAYRTFDTLRRLLFEIAQTLERPFGMMKVPFPLPPFLALVHNPKNVQPGRCGKIKCR